MSKFPSKFYKVSLITYLVTPSFLSSAKSSLDEANLSPSLGSASHRTKVIPSIGQLKFFPKTHTLSPGLIFCNILFTHPARDPLAFSCLFIPYLVLIVKSKTSVNSALIFVFNFVLALIYFFGAFLKHTILELYVKQSFKHLLKYSIFKVPFIIQLNISLAIDCLHT